MSNEQNQPQAEVRVREILSQVYPNLTKARRAYHELSVLCPGKLFAMETTTEGGYKFNQQERQELPAEPENKPTPNPTGQPVRQEKTPVRMKATSVTMGSAQAGTASKASGNKKS